MGKGVDTFELNSARVSRTSIKSLMFGHVQVTDDESYADLSNSLLGVIKLEVCWLKRTFEATGRLEIPKTNNNIVHERAKKGIEHVLSLGEAIPSSCNTCTGQDIGLVLATFQFVYRPKAYLQASEIIPRSPHPPKKTVSPSRSATDGINPKKEQSESPDSDSEQEEYIRKLEETAKRARATFEARKHDGPKAKRSKKEPTVINVPHNVNGAVIDLTLD